MTVTTSSNLNLSMSNSIGTSNNNILGLPLETGQVTFGEMALG